MAVFTDLSDEDRDIIAHAFGLGALTSVIGIADGDRETTFLFRSVRGKFIVTLFESGVQTSELERAFCTMEDLCAARIPCPHPIRRQDGVATISLGGKLVAVVSFLDGSPLALADAGACHDLGRQTGKIHRLLRRPEAISGGLPRGPVHGALCRENVFFLNGTVSGIINFRLGHEDVLAGEVAAVLCEWAMEADGTLAAERAEAIVAGYHDARPLEEAEWRVLPALILSAAAMRHAIEGHPERALSQANAIVASALSLCKIFS